MCQLSNDDKRSVAQRGYNIMRVLAHGSCSIVYLCAFKKIPTEKELERESQEDEHMAPLPLVCKVMEAVEAPRDFIQKFLPREIANLCRIRHAKLPHLIHIHSILQYKTKVMVFMRHAELGTLCDYIKIHKEPLSEKLSRFWFRQLSVAITFLHKMEVVHRDIKCENILVTANYNVKLSDFGFSRLCIDTKGKQATSSTYCGSMGYAAPELLKGVPYYPKASDIWSMGIVLFVMLNAAMPFSTDNPSQLLAAQVSRTFRFRTIVSERISSEVKELVSQMLEPNWTERIATNNLLKCPWLVNAVPSKRVRELEEAAMKNAEQLRKDGLKNIKKILEVNKLSAALTVIDEENSTPASEIGYPIHDARMEDMVSKESLNSISFSH